MAVDGNFIRIRGARTHNLRNIDLDIPRGKLVVFTGVSGSGKSSLAFDTLYAEGRQRYLETVAPSARKLIDRLDRADVDAVDGLPPTIAVDQLDHSIANPRATVATLSEIHDYLRILYARAGEVFCYQCGRPISAQSLTQILDETEALPQGERIHILAPLVRSKKGRRRDEFLLIRREGFVRARLDGVLTLVDSPPDIDEDAVHSLEMVVDRQIIRPDMRPRLTESFQTALKFGNGVAIVALDREGEWVDRVYNTRLVCHHCDIVYPEIEPRLFSFNSPHGACPVCQGLGRLPAQDEGGEGPVCPTCNGARLGKIPLAIRWNGRNIAEWAQLAVDEALAATEANELPAAKQKIVAPLLQQIESRLRYLARVGVGYLQLDRPLSTLSGGESQRIRLASCLGSGLNGACYVLDEPTIGLHPRDAGRLLDVLDELRNRDNSVLVVEHDEAALRRADWLVDIGPGAGEHGGDLVQQGSLKDFLNGPGLTAEYLSGRKSVDQGFSAKAPPDRFLVVEGVRRHSLDGVTVRIPIGRLVGVTGVSGSGKSTLVLDVLAPAVKAALAGAAEQSGRFSRLSGVEAFEKLIETDQSPIGRTPRSTPASFSGVLDPIRQVFARTREAKARGYTANRFSPNNKAGQCVECQGLGAVKIDLSFLPDLYAKCAVCGGRRFNRATLDIRYRGQTIADVLEMTVSAAAEFFANHAKIARILNTLAEVGLGYLRLGQWGTTLSGGEAQRLKLATELARPPESSRRRSPAVPANTLYILDEPTTGLHFEDIRHLLVALRRLVEQGHTVILIEHQLDIIRNCDWIIDLGPEGGAGGGKIVFEGPVADLLQHPSSHTAKALRESASPR